MMQFVQSVHLPSSAVSIMLAMYLFPQWYALLTTHPHVIMYSWLTTLSLRKIRVYPWGSDALTIIKWCPSTHSFKTRQRCFASSRPISQPIFLCFTKLTKRFYYYFYGDIPTRNMANDNILLFFCSIVTQSLTLTDKIS